jgi:hypothetical protein
MNKREAMYFALGVLRGCLDCGKDYNVVELESLFGEKYKKYILGFTNCNSSIGLIDIEAPKTDDLRRRVIEISRDLDGEQIVGLLLEALAYDIRNNKK